MTATDGIVAVILAAGLSQRFGTDKLLHPVDGKPLAAHIADTIAAIPLAHSVAVCPRDHRARRALFESRGFVVIDNADPARGLASSLVLAARHAIGLDAEGLLVCLADMPKVTASHLLALIETGRDADVVATQSGGTRCPPAIFARGVLPRLLELTGDHGARDLLRTAATVEASPELIRDVDTPADLT